MPYSNFFLNFAGMITFSILTLFWILVKTGIIFYRILNQRIVDMTNKPLGTCLSEVVLKTWLYNHCLVTQYTSILNRYFGPIILIAICHAFVIVITTSYQLVMAIENTNLICMTIFGSIVLRELVFLSFLIWEAYVLQSEVIYYTIYALNMELIFNFQGDKLKGALFWLNANSNKSCDTKDLVIF